MSQTRDNPMGTDGFEFVEYTAPDPQLLRTLFERMGFPVKAQHRSKNVTLHGQGGINFIINAEPASFAQQFARAAWSVRLRHGISRERCGLCLSPRARARRQARPAERRARWSSTSRASRVSAARSSTWSTGTASTRSTTLISGLSPAPTAPDAGLNCIDHLTHNVQRGHMDVWKGFYERLFNFREIRYFDIEGKQTGLFSRALTSPCGKIRIPINESQDDKSQIEEYLREYHGEGIQHIALASDDIYRTVDALPRSRARLPGHARDVLRSRRWTRHGASRAAGGAARAAAS